MYTHIHRESITSAIKAKMELETYRTGSVDNGGRSSRKWASVREM
jgi:hypothetical protein